MPNFYPRYSPAHVKDAVIDLLKENMDEGISKYNAFIENSVDDDGEDLFEGFRLDPIKTYSNAAFRNDDDNKLSFGRSPALSVVVNQFASDEFEAFLGERLNLYNLVLALTVIDNKTAKYQGIRQSVRETIQRKVDLMLQLITDIITPEQRADTIRYRGSAVAQNFQLLAYTVADGVGELDVDQRSYKAITATMVFGYDLVRAQRG